jgi:cell division protease FtsH
MSDTQNSQGDKARRPRPFGPFLLFLTILVVVLVAFGSSKLQGPKPMTHDSFWNELYTGNVEFVELKGDKQIVLRLVDGTLHKLSFPGLSEHEAEIQRLAALTGYRKISQADIGAAIDRGYFEPETFHHVTTSTLHTEVVKDDQSATEGQAQEREQEDRLFVVGTSKPADGWTELRTVEVAASSGQAWFEVERPTDIAQLKRTLGAAGAQGQSLFFDLTKTHGTVHSMADSTLGSLLILWGPWVLIFLVFLLFMRQMRNQGSGAGVMSFGRSRAQLYNKESHTNVTFDDVAGAQEAKDEVREVVEFLKNPGRFTRIGGRIPRGVLLTGPPGCGKTLLAKAIAGEAEVPFFSISGSDFVEMFVGVGASRVRDLFKQARENSPCIIFLDEIDAVGRRRGSGMGGGHDEREQTLNAILVEMDGFGTDEGIIVVAATNRPDVLDPALLRPGRFDREVTIELPDMEGRDQILTVHLKKVKVADELDVHALAKATPGYSGADLAAIVNEAAIMAVLDKREVIEMHHLEEATAKVRYGRKKTSRKIEDDDLTITAYHESGHTIVASKLPEVDMPHKVTIVPRGRALGATMMLPERESYHMQRRKLLGQLATLFGGRVAEEVFCGDISAGASDDIRRATELARAMVTELGMSEKVGPINYAERQGSDFLGTELMSGKWHSEETARVIDEEIERILREAYQCARDLIDGERESIERLTRALLKYETLDRHEIELLIAGTQPADLRPSAPEPSETVRKPRAALGPKAGREDLGGLSGEAGLSPA